MSSGHNSHQHDEDLYTPLDSNGELSNRSLSSNQRPSEGNTLIYAVRIDVWLFVEVTLSVYMYAQNLNIYHWHHKNVLFAWIYDSYSYL